MSLLSFLISVIGPRTYEGYEGPSTELRIFEVYELYCFGICVNASVAIVEHTAFLATITNPGGNKYICVLPLKRPIFKLYSRVVLRTNFMKHIFKTFPIPRLEMLIKFNIWASAEARF